MKNWRELPKKKAVKHQPVLLKEALEALRVGKDKTFLDATLGAGGHAREIIKAGGKLLAIDADPEMLAAAEDNLGEGNFVLKEGNFKDLARIASEAGFKKFDGILFDLGISMIHYKGVTRGFSFAQKQAPLDMRLNPETQSVTAADLLMGLREDQLTDLFLSITGKVKAKSLANKIVKVRERKPIRTVADLLAFVGEKKTRRTHPATEVFLALRIAVNSELENLKEALPKAFSLLKKGGRLVVISFHSEEDALVKNFFKNLAQKGEVKIVTKKPILPSAAETEENPSARSAKLRILEKK